MTTLGAANWTDPDWDEVIIDPKHIEIVEDPPGDI
jgi:hypothetical protein